MSTTRSIAFLTLESKGKKPQESNPPPAEALSRSLFPDRVEKIQLLEMVLSS